MLQAMPAPPAACAGLSHHGGRQGTPADVLARERQVALLGSHVSESMGPCWEARGTAMTAPQWHFEDFRLDLVNACLWHGAEALALPPKAFNVLHYLVTHQDRLVTKDELLDRIWPETAVTDAVVRVAIGVLRKALDDTRRPFRVIATVSRWGYRFLPPVTLVDPPAAAPQEAGNLRRCAICQHPLSHAARFCATCGAPVTETCPTCGQVVPLPATFCPGCGQRLEAVLPAASPNRWPTDVATSPQAGLPLPTPRAPTGDRQLVTVPERTPLAYTPTSLVEKIHTSRATLEGERKQVTVLFADITDSLELIRSLDPEAAQQLLDPALHAMMDAVHRYEGTVNQVLGDGIMALFGAPIAHEDHAARACYAALAMQAALRDYAEEVRRAHGVALQSRIGLNSGEVVVRTIRNDLHMDYSAVGYFEQALNALPHRPEQHDTGAQAIDLRLALNSALELSDDWERSLVLLGEAESLAVALDDPGRLGQVLLSLSLNFRTRGTYDAAIATAQRALALATASGEWVLQARANLLLGLASLSQGNYRRAIDCFRQTVASLDGAQRRECSGVVTQPGRFMHVHARAQLAYCHAELGTFAEGRALGEEGLKMAEVVAHPLSLVLALWGGGQLSLRQGDLHRALPRLERAMDICQETDLSIFFPLIAAALGAAYTLAGRIIDAVRVLTQTMEQSGTTAWIAPQIVCRLSLGQAQLLAGRREEVHALAERALTLARERQERGHQAYALRLLGEVAALRESPASDEVREYYRQALALAEELGMRPLQAHCHLGLGTLYNQMGQA
jgi:class 3 adenylate cyclase/DNA-binding winged helix-turn-helix (wHTH) protein